MKLLIRVTASGFAGLTKAYTSVLSASGSWLISGASRWLDAEPAGEMATASTVAPTIAERVDIRVGTLTSLRALHPFGGVTSRNSFRIGQLPARRIVPDGSGRPPGGSSVT